MVREALESVLAQDYPDFECLVVDDAGTEALIFPTTCASVFRYVANTGIAAVLNTGLDPRPR